MEVNKLKSRIIDLDKGIQQKNADVQQAMADLNIMIGAKAELERWIKELDGDR